MCYIVVRTKTIINNMEKKMDKRKLQAVINRLEDDINALKFILKKEYKERDKIVTNINSDIEYYDEQVCENVVNSSIYEIDLEIESTKGCISANEDVLERLEMLKESIKGEK